MLSANGERDIKTLRVNPDNPRRDIRSDPNFEGLVASIKSQGIIQPLLINDEGMILAGHRRYEAALVLRLARVPVRVLSGGNHALVPLVENLQRADLGVLEVAEYLRTYSRETGATLVEISEVTGISNTTISKYIKLADAPIELKERVERDDIPLNAAFELLRHDADFIREVVKTPNLSKQIVRDRANATKSKSPVHQHLEYAIAAVEHLLAQSPDEAFSVRYNRWLNVLKDDLADLAPPEVETSFRGAVNAFQRQPSKPRSATLEADS